MRTLLTLIFILSVFLSISGCRHADSCTKQPENSALLLSTNAANTVAIPNIPLPTEQEILALLLEADKARGSCTGLTYKVAISGYLNGKSETNEFLIKSSGVNVFADTLAPPQSYGNQILVTTNGYWFYKSGISKPLPLTPQHRLAGCATYGDLQPTNFSGKSPTSIGAAMVENELCYSMDFTENDNYISRIYIPVDTRLVKRLEQYDNTASLKRIALFVYDNSLPDSAPLSPFIFSIIIADAGNTNSSTTINFSAPTAAIHPEHIFEVSSLISGDGQ